MFPSGWLIEDFERLDYASNGSACVPRNGVFTISSVFLFCFERLINKYKKKKVMHSWQLRGKEIRCSFGLKDISLKRLHEYITGVKNFVVGTVSV